MRLFSQWILFIAFACIGVGAELHLPVFNAGTNSYSNVIVTASSGGRVLIEYPKGMASARVAELDLETQEKLANAGVLTGGIAKDIYKAVEKRDAAKRKAEKKAERAARGDAEAPPLSLEKAQHESIARLLASQITAAAEENDVELDLQALIGRFGAMMFYGISGALLVLSLLRKYLYFRICKNATGNSSFFVFVPLFRWLVLASAAGMSKLWLLVPTFAAGALFVPPEAVNRFPWAGMAWLILIGFLWLTTAILYLVWCVRLCRAVDCSGWLALLLIPPVLDFIALLVLAFAGTRQEVAPVSVQLKKPILAI